ncbi:MAG TPA: hypothetical protein VM452_06145 [Caulifigura sp.]|jgi:predicted RNase H-like HicB family nuclease|nr:hypothetical protein [Caulifigura sp.]
MLSYKAAFYIHDDGVSVQALDFPAVLSSGKDVDEARMMIRSALVEMVQYFIETGRVIPLPNAALNDPEADFVEPLALVLEAISPDAKIPAEAGV